MIIEKTDQELAGFFANAFKEAVLPAIEKMYDKQEQMAADIKDLKTSQERIERKQDKQDDHLDRHDKKLDNHEKRISSLEPKSSLRN